MSTKQLPTELIELVESYNFKIPNKFPNNRVEIQINDNQINVYNLEKFFSGGWFSYVVPNFNPFRDEFINAIANFYTIDDFVEFKNYVMNIVEDIESEQYYIICEMNSRQSDSKEYINEHEKNIKNLKKKLKRIVKASNIMKIYNRTLEFEYVYDDDDFNDDFNDF